MQLCFLPLQMSILFFGIYPEAGFAIYEALQDLVSPHIPLVYFIVYLSSP